MDQEFLASHSEGLIAPPAAWQARSPRTIDEGAQAARKRKLDWYYEVFGPDRFFLELQHHDIPELDDDQQGAGGAGPALQRALYRHQ